MKRRRLWLFLAKLVPLTLALGYAWFAWVQLRYPDIIEPLARPLFSLCGVTQWWLNLILEHFTSIVPYLALILSTPGITRQFKRFALALFGGVAAIVLGHILMSVAVFHILEAFPGSRISYILIVPVYLINDAMPLILWLLFFPGILGDLFSSSRRRADSYGK